MYLKRIELQGFKSFPDKLSLDFDNVISVIVGPNGSGKSNIADAVRWVLGEQSVKSLRGQKWDDVIFAGTQNRRPLGFAEVSLTIDNLSGEINSEYSEITVTRKVYRSGDSEYLINNRNCRLRDIRELFMDTGVGKEGYSIIGQGRIDDILNARSDERRQIFEEASGIVKFKTRRLEAFSKLDNEHKNLTRLSDIISEIESSIDTLREQSEAAKKFLELSEKLRLYEVNLFLIEEKKLREESDRFDALFENNNAAIEEKKALKTKNSELSLVLKSEIDSLSQQIAELREKVYENRSSQEQSINNIKINEANILHFRGDIERLHLEIDASNVKSEKNAADTKLLEARINRERLLLNESEHKLSKTQEEYSKLNEILSDSETEIEQYKNEIIANIRTTSDIQSSISHLQSMLENARERKEKIELASEKTAETLRQKQETITELQSEIEKSTQAHRLLADKKQNLISEKDRLTSLRGERHEAYEAISKEAIKKKERFKVLSSMAKEHEGFFRSVKEILNAAGIGILTGIKGVAGEVITVSKEYEVAIEIAMGQAIQNIITDDENAAKRAIEYLKHNNFGRATFLPLKTAKPPSPLPASVLSHAGIIGSAKSLISYDAQFEPVIGKLLERVVVAENMSAAIDFSRKTSYAYKVVTLGGELISPQGAITGGSLNEKRVNVFSRNREINEIELLLTELNSKKDALERELKCTDDSIVSVKSELDTVYREIEEALLKINTLEQRLASETSELASVKEQSGQNDVEIRQIVEQTADILRTIDEKKALLEKTDAERTAIEERISERQTLSLADKELRERKFTDSTNLRIKVAETNSQLTALGAEIERLNAENSAAAEGVEIHKREISRTEQMIADVEKQTADFVAVIDGLKDECTALEAEIVSRETQKLEKETETERINNEIEALGVLITELNGDNIRIETKKERQQEELQRLFDEMWEDYEITLREARKYEVLEESFTKMQRVSKELKAEIRELGSVNVAAIEQYRETKERYEFLQGQKNDILGAEEKLREIIKELTELMEATFTEQFAAISENFDAVFKEMFGGGRANLELSDESSPLESGIEIVAELPGKKLQNISLLSGGEKALTAIALLFGILRMKPSPFCILDEIEAALDDANIVRFASYLGKLKDSTQFIVITHRKGTMESANILYGVTMEEQGVSKLISLNLEEAVS